MQPERVLAFDPGFERLGVAVLERHRSKERVLYSSCVRTKATLPFVKRLQEIGEEATRLIKKWNPSVIALEEIYFEKNAKTAMQVAQVRGVLAYIAAHSGTSVVSYTPLEVKVAITGYGKSDKAAVGAMVARLVELPQRKRLDDELDAIAIGITCLASQRYPQKCF